MTKQEKKVVLDYYQTTKTKGAWEYCTCYHDICHCESRYYGKLEGIEELMRELKIERD